MENVNVDNSVGISENVKRYLGVTKRNDKWRARIWHPKLKTSIELGYYDSAEEAAIVVQKKKAQFVEMFKRNDSVITGATLDNVNVERPMDISGKGGPFLGVSKWNDKWRARAWHPWLKSSIGLGYYDTPEEASAVVQKKKAEFAEMFKQSDSAIIGATLDNVNVDKSVDFSGKWERFLGVSKRNDKWWARVWHPWLETSIGLGYYDSREEASAVVQKKKAEFAEIFEQSNSATIGATLDNVDVEKSVGISKKGERYLGVTRRNGKWRARIWHPKLKTTIGLGYYGSLEEASVVVQKKKAEFAEMFKQNDRATTGATLDNVNVERSVHISGKGGPFLGVSKRNDKWWARVWHSGLKTSIGLGYYDSPEEAAAVVQKKKAEFREMFKEDSSVRIDNIIAETSSSFSQKRRRFIGVTKMNDNWRVGVCHPKLKTKIHLGYNASPEEAAVAVQKKNAKYRKMFKQEDSMSTGTKLDHVNGKTSSGVSEKGNRFKGVSESRGKWRARVWHPKLKTQTQLGYYSSPEEAAAAVQKKKAEYEEMFKRKGSAFMATNETELKGRMFYSGVYTSSDNNSGEHNWHLTLNQSISSGSPGSLEEAAVTEKRVKLGKMHGRRKGIEPSSEGFNDVLEEPGCRTTFADVDDYGAVKVPAGVRSVQSGNWTASISDPESKARIWLGTEHTFAGPINEKKDVCAANRNWVQFEEMTEFRNNKYDTEATDNPEDPECEFVHGSVLSLQNFNCWAVSDTGNNAAIEDAVACDKLQSNSVYGFSSSVLEPQVSSSVDVVDKSVTREDIQRRIVSASSFDEAVSFFFID